MHLEEFKAILANYHVSSQNKNILNKTKLVLLVAPTSVGRNTIIRQLIKTGKFDFIVSDTTRKPRINDGVQELNGVEYWFRRERDVLDDLKQGKFLEAAIIHNQQVSGISVRELQRVSDEGKIGITDIEVVGVHNIIEAKPDTIAIFVLPPSFDEWMRRIIGRGRLSDNEKLRRLVSAAEEFSAAINNDYYYFVLNDDLDHAANQIMEISVQKTVNTDEQVVLRKLAKQLLAQTKKHITEYK